MADGDSDVIVVGAGWAGLAAAVRLAEQGVAVSLLDAARTPGGRARTVTVDGQDCDNGQHLLLGAYHEFLRMLQTLGVPERDVVERRPLFLAMRDTQGERLTLRAPRLPAPLHLLAAMITARGLTARQKRSMLTCCARLAWHRYRLSADMTVDEWLAEQGQDEQVCDLFWRPLCLAALTTEPSRASARIFLTVLRDAFSRTRSDSDYLFARRSLGDVLPVPAVRYLRERGARVLLGERVRELIMTDGRVCGVRTAHALLEARHVILAVGPQASRNLLLPHAVFEPTCYRLAALFSEPIATVYLHYAGEGPVLPVPMVGLVSTLTQWLMDHGYWGRPGVLAAVISAGGRHMRLGREALAERVAAEVAALYPELPPPLRVTVIREKRATFSCRVDVDQLRPDSDTGVEGCWLAGDYTASDYPATLESALRSGAQAASSVLCALRIEAEPAALRAG